MGQLEVGATPCHVCNYAWRRQAVNSIGGEPRTTDVASSLLTAIGARTTTRARWQSGGARHPTTNDCGGHRQNQRKLDSARSAHLPIAASFRLSALQA